MTDVRELVREVGEELAPVEGRLVEHPYLGAVEAGQLDRRSLGLFAAQQRYIIPSDLRSIGLLVNRYGAEPSGPFFVASIGTETAALGALGAFERALGRDERSLEAGEILPGAVAYSHYVAWLALYGSDAEFAAAFLLNLRAWGRNCGRMARALRQAYGFEEADVAFFDLFAADAPEWEASALEVIERGLRQGVRRDEIALAARLLQGYELIYWDSLYDASR